MIPRHELYEGRRKQRTSRQETSIYMRRHASYVSLRIRDDPWCVRFDE